MRLDDQLRSVRHTFSANRARALLTLLGIMIGTGSIVLLAGVLRAGEEALLRTSQRATESDLVTIRPDDPPARQAKRGRRKLDAIDAALLDESPLLEGAGVAVESIKDIVVERPVRRTVRLVGATPASAELYHLELSQGRLLEQADLDERRNVCVIGFELWRVLLDERSDALGQTLRLDGQPYTVVGVLKHKPPLDGSTGFWTWDGRAMIPQPVFDAHYRPAHDVQRLFVRLKGLSKGAPLVGRTLAAAREVMRATVLRRHNGVENFKVDDDPSGQNTMALVLFIIKALLLGTGLLSLFVGGINIMNIMLVTVTERTREIGVRRALGATPRDIVLQFLLEAALISLVGGLLGAGGGVALTWLVHVVLERLLGAWAMYVEGWSVGLGLALALSTGALFGLFPAWRAGRLDPVEALRYEA
jgi:putative ABC transport system permease protein